MHVYGIEFPDEMLAHLPDVLPDVLKVKAHHG